MISHKTFESTCILAGLRILLLSSVFCCSYCYVKFKTIEYSVLNMYGMIRGTLWTISQTLNQRS